MSQNELVFAALGGLGEIGRNAALYGYGQGRSRKWFMVDCGLSFAGPDIPGIDLLYPDPLFAESIADDLLGVVITHAHEDHIGAVAALWPRLNCPIYATRFALSLLEARRLNEPNAPMPQLVEIRQSERFQLGPFDIEPIAMSHSIPESCALALRTPAGLFVHTGDWKLDQTPGIGAPTDEARLRALGDEGVSGLICDSTNILREGESPSENEVAKVLAQIMAGATGRVVVTTFASNLARIKAVAQAAEINGRSVVVVGRSLDRVIAVGRECGYLEGIAPFLPQQSFGELPPRHVVVLATGSQGEARAAMARIGSASHPVVKLASGDMTIFSSRTIPGNERAVGVIINGLVDQGVQVLTDRDALVHCSGHPRREEVRRLYEWLRPRLLVPAHGEAVHLTAHAAFARECGIEEVISPRDGDLTRLAPGPAAIIDKIPHGVLAEDGFVLVDLEDEILAERRRLAFAGVVSVAIAVTPKADMAGDPDIILSGAPKRGQKGELLEEIVENAIFETFDGLPRSKRRDSELLGAALEKSVRAALKASWGKKPQVHVLIIET